MEEPRAIEHIEMQIMDAEHKYWETRRFLLSMAGVRRIKQALKIKHLKEALTMDALDAGVPILWEALLDKGDMTREQFEERLPSHLDVIGRTTTAILFASIPLDDKPAENRPTPANSEPEQTIQ